MLVSFLYMELGAQLLQGYGEHRRVIASMSGLRLSHAVANRKATLQLQPTGLHVRAPMQQMALFCSGQLQLPHALCHTRAQ
jgi:hypothetical protein